MQSGRGGPVIAERARGAILVLSNSRTRGALAAVRALGAAGWRVGVATPDGDGLAVRSRWCERGHVVPRPRGDGADFVAAASAVVERHGYDVLVGAADDWAAASARWADRLPCVVAHPGRHTVRRAIDKLELASLAEQHGLRSPRTVLATDDELDRWSGPALVKCRSHWREGVVEDHRIEASRHDAIDREARDAVQRIRDAGLEAVLQEPVAGELAALVGVVVDGRLRGRVQQVTSGTWPTPVGVSSSATTVPVDEQLAEPVSSLLAELGWVGLLELQFLVEPGREPAVIDLNGRYYGSLALALAAGPNLPDVSARLALGERPSGLLDGRAGVTYVWAAGELRRATAERRGGLLRDLAGSCRRVVRADVRSVADRTDPAPVLWLATERFRRRD